MTAKLGAEAHAAILLSVAVKTRSEARKAWRRANAHPSETTLRPAFRACVLAARASHRAAKAWAHDASVAHSLIAAAKTLDAAALDFKDRLVAAVVE